MKTRSSLVSNSLTSSFICLLPKEKHDEIVENLIVDLDHPEIYRKMLNSDKLIICCRKFGKDMISFSYTRGNLTIPESDELVGDLNEEESNLIQEDEDCHDIISTMISNYTDEVLELERKHPDMIFFSREVSDN